MTEPGTAEETLKYYREVVEVALAQAQPLSLRARILTTMLRFAERGERILASVAAKELPFRHMAIIIEVRDMARREQEWVTTLLRDEAPPADIEERLLLYRQVLAVCEAASMMTLAYLGSDKENSEEAGWWAARSGELVPTVLSLAPELLSLPADKVAA